MSKKDIRRQFRDAVFERDHYTCLVCGKEWTPADADPNLHRINAHHITDRSEMPHGGYVPENGVTVCEGECHRRVERYHETGEVEPHLSPDALYQAIGTCKGKAVRKSRLLGRR